MRIGEYPFSKSLSFFLVVILFLGSSCASQRLYHRGQKAMKVGDYDAAVEYYSKALARSPDNIQYRTTLERARIAAADFHFRRGESILEAQPDNPQALESAILEYQLAVNYDPTHQFAAAKLQNAIRKLNALRAAESEKLTQLEAIKQKVERAQLLEKALNPRSAELIDIKWQDTKLSQILDAMGRMAGINVVYDRDFRDENYSIELYGVTFREALEQILSANNLFYKIINENTIMIIPDTPNKRRQHEELVVKTFYLSNAEINDMINLIRNVAQIQRVTPNTQLNAITVKDTPEKVALAERIIKMNDKSRAEVILDIEILEVNRQTLTRYGIDITPGLEISQQLDIGEGAGKIFGHQFGAIDAASWSFQLPGLVYRAIRTSSNTRVLAKPQVRASDGQQVTIRLGNRVPIPIQSFQSVIGGQQGGGLVTPITQFQLTDVGINIDITPRVHHNREVTLQLRFELSSIASPGASVAEPPTLGNRTINTTIRLKDSETNLLAGLIRQDERRSMRGIPGIDHVPLLRHLFSANDRQIEQTDVIFTITPHIIRMPNITEADLTPIWIGTEDNPAIKKPPTVTPFEGGGEEIPGTSETPPRTLQPQTLEPELGFADEPATRTITKPPQAPPPPTPTEPPQPPLTTVEESESVRPTPVPESTPPESKPTEEVPPEKPTPPPAESVTFTANQSWVATDSITIQLMTQELQPGDRVRLTITWDVEAFGRPTVIAPGSAINPEAWTIEPSPEGIQVFFTTKSVPTGTLAEILSFTWNLIPQDVPMVLNISGRVDTETSLRPVQQSLSIPLKKE